MTQLFYVRLGCLILFGIVWVIHVANGYQYQIELSTPDSGPVSMINGFNYIDHIKYLNEYGHSGNSLIFKYSCDGARIILLETTSKSTDQGIYEIVLYPKSRPEKIVVRRNKDGVIEDLVSSFIPGLLEHVDCPNFRPIWITWENGFFSLGKGLSLYVNEVYNWTDPEPFVISSTGIMTSYGASGKWIIYIEAPFPGKFGTCGMFDTQAMMTVLEEYTLINEQLCGYICSNTENCMGFNYNVISKLCALVSSGEVIHTASVPHWVFYTRGLPVQSAGLYLACY
ncbi:unnamed protein product [Mytilus coruscus]|uniref:Farnesoic acid O-methyl transferase domain-containing protein n=1 Tax=Mytilus coruscus TaxID=42192 RepID=A0A6J8APS9_MYTCO|nr:unnamed protein product [Mytilus coruscus]